GDGSIAGSLRRIAKAAGLVLPGDTGVDGFLGRPTQGRVGRHAVGLAKGDGGQGLFIATAAGKAAIDVLPGEQPLQPALDVLGTDLILISAFMVLAGSQQG